MDKSTGGKNPNILVIYPDQLRYDSMGCAGNAVVKTPHFDRLALEGARFTRAYASYPLCCPFRASLVTGKYAHATGMYANHFPIDTNQNFLAPNLKEQGYDTAFFGKWHLYGGPLPGFVPPGPDRLGFDRFVGFNRGHHYMKALYWKDTDQPYHCPRWEPDFQTDQLVDYIEERKDEESPFFAYMCYGPPHYPNDMPEHLKNLYSPEEVVLPPGVPDPKLQIRTQKWKLEHDCDGNEAALDKSHSGAKKEGPFDPESEQEIREFIAQYYGMVTGIDQNVGRVLNCLDRTGLADNTVVILLSDHGDMFGQNGSFCGVKRSYHDASMHVPVIVRYPGVAEAGKVIDEMIDVGVDTMPTLLEICGRDIPAEVQGTSYLPLLDGSSSFGRENIMYQIIGQDNCEGGGTYLPIPERGVRNKKWLYVRKQNLRVCLYDLEKDPDELNNLVKNDTLADIMDTFDQLIETHMDETDDSWDLLANWPPPQFVGRAEAKENIKNNLLKNAIVHS